MAERVGLHFVRLVTLTAQHSDANVNAPISDEQQKKTVHKHQISWSRKKPVRFPSKAALWTVIKLSIRFPQYTCCIWLFFFLKKIVFVFSACMRILTSQFTLPRYSATIRSLRPWESCFDHLTPVILFHLNRHPPLHTHLQHKHKSPRLTGHCWQTKVISFKFPAHDHWWEPEFHRSLGNSDRGNHIDAVCSWNQSFVLGAFEGWSTTGAYTSELTEICYKGDDLQVCLAAGRNGLLRIHRGSWHHFNLNVFLVQTEIRETLHNRHL